MSDPIIPSGYKSLREAFDALGKHTFGDKWTGNEAESRSPEQRAKERQQEIDRKRKRIDGIVIATPQMSDADAAVFVGNIWEEGEQMYDLYKEELRSLAASDPTVLSPEEISQIDNEVEREAALHLRDKLNKVLEEARATTDTIEDATRGRHDSAVRELRRRLCSPGLAVAVFRRNRDGRQDLVPPNLWISEIFTFWVVNSRAVWRRDMRENQGTVLFTNANFARLMEPDLPKASTVEAEDSPEPIATGFDAAQPEPEVSAAPGQAGSDAADAAGPRKDDPLGQRIAAVLEEARRRLEGDSTLATNKMAKQMVLAKRAQNFGDEVVRKIIDGRYPAAQSRGFKGVGTPGILAENTN